MHTFLTESLVLRLTPFREADWVVHLLSRDRGLLPLVARGARKSRKRFGGALDYFCAVQAEVRPSRQGMGTLLGVELVRAFHGPRSDVQRYWAGCHFLEVVRRGSREGDPAPELYALLLASLDALERGTDIASLVRVFQTRALASLGYSPGLEACPSCGGPLAPAAAAGGCIACSPCAGSGSVPMSAGALQTLRAALRLPLDRLGNLKASGAVERELGVFLQTALGAALGVDPERLKPSLQASFRD